MQTPTTMRSDGATVAEVEVDAPPATVWQFIAEPRDIALWHPFVDRGQTLDGRGSGRRDTFSTRGGGAVVGATLRAFEPPRRIAAEVDWVASSRDGQVWWSGAVEINLEPAGRRK